MKTRRLNSDEFFWLFAAFFIPCVILMLSLNKAPDLLFSSVTRQMRDIEQMKGLLSQGRIFYSDFLCDILTRRFYPSFILCLLIGGRLGSFLLRIFFYFRFGLLSAGVYRFSSEHVKNSKHWSALLSVACAVSAVSLVASTNPQVFNVMIVMPYVAASVDDLLRNDSKINYWKTVVCFSMFITGGIYGILTGLIFTVCVVFFFKSLIGQVKVRRAFMAYGVSLICMLPVFIPLAFAGLKFIDIGQEFTNSHVSFKCFDLLTSMLDGSVIEIPLPGINPVMSMTILVMMLVLLFFLNRSIPFKAKACAVLMIVLIPVSASWTLLSAILSVVGNPGTAEFSRFTALCIVLFLMAAISLRNITNLKSSDIYISVFSILALITVANSSSSGEVSRSIFNLWYSGGAAIFWGICFLLFLSDKKKAVNVFVALGAAGIAINTMYSLSVSTMYGNISSISPYSSADPKFDIIVESDDYLPLAGDFSECINVEADLREGIDQLTVPAIYNVISRNSVLGELFEQADAFTVFASGVNEMVPGLYSVNVPGDSTEVLLRAEGMDPGSAYYLYSSFGGQVTLTEQYSETDVESTFTGSYFKQIRRGTSDVNLRQVTSPSESSACLSLWRVNDSVLNELIDRVVPMNRYDAVIEGPNPASMPGYNTIVTSVSYSDNYRIRVKGPDGNVSCDTFDMGGKLAGVYYSDGISDYQIRITSDNSVAIVSIIVWILCSGVVIYNVVRNTEHDRSGKGTADAEQKDN